MTEERKEVLEEEFEEELFVTLEFDDGTTEECKPVAIFELEDKEYIVLDPEDGTDELYFYGYKEVGEDEFELMDIDTDEEFNMAVEAFNQLMDEEETEEH